MKKIFFTILVVFSVTLLCAQDGLNKLELAAKEMKFVYKIPGNAVIVPPVKQEDVLYFVGFSNDFGNIEFRIAAYPPSQLPDQPGAAKEELKGSLEMLALAVALNISQNESTMPEYYYFTDSAVKNEFGGDVGFSIVVEGNSNFSKGFKYVNVNLIYKKNRGIVIVYVLFNELEYYMEHVAENVDLYYCFKFLD